MADLSAAEGYIELGMYQDAWDELETLSDDEKVSPEVCHLRLRIFIGSEAWSNAALFADSLLVRGDKDPWTVILSAACDLSWA